MGERSARSRRRCRSLSESHSQLTASMHPLRLCACTGFSSRAVEWALARYCDAEVVWDVPDGRRAWSLLAGRLVQIDDDGRQARCSDEVPESHLVHWA
jgi:hypothetical protein